MEVGGDICGWFANVGVGWASGTPRDRAIFAWTLNKCSSSRRSPCLKKTSVAPILTTSQPPVLSPSRSRSTSEPLLRLSKAMRFPGPPTVPKRVMLADSGGAGGAAAATGVVEGRSAWRLGRNRLRSAVTLRGIDAASGAGNDTAEAGASVNTGDERGAGFGILASLASKIRPSTLAARTGSSVRWRLRVMFPPPTDSRAQSIGGIVWPSPPGWPTGTQPR